MRFFCWKRWHSSNLTPQEYLAIALPEASCELNTIGDTLVGPKPAVWSVWLLPYHSVCFVTVSICGRQPPCNSSMQEKLNKQHLYRRILWTCMDRKVRTKDEIRRFHEQNTDKISKSQTLWSLGSAYVNLDTVDINLPHNSLIRSPDAPLWTCMALDSCSAPHRTMPCESYSNQGTNYANAKSGIIFFWRVCWKIGTNPRYSKHFENTFQCFIYSLSSAWQSHVHRFTAS